MRAIGRNVRLFEETECQMDVMEFLFGQDYLWKIIDKLGIRRRRALKRFSENRDSSIDSSKIPRVLRLKPGEVVRVRSEDEILSTLTGAKYKGLSFMPEMLRFCGEKFKVLKRVERYIVEGGETRSIRPKNTVLLDGVFCDGSWHGGCDRTCYCLWREKWLKRI